MTKNVNTTELSLLVFPMKSDGTASRERQQTMENQITIAVLSKVVFTLYRRTESYLYEPDFKSASAFPASASREQNKQD